MLRFRHHGLSIINGGINNTHIHTFTEQFTFSLSPCCVSFIIYIVYRPSTIALIRSTFSYYRFQIGISEIFSFVGLRRTWFSTLTYLFLHHFLYLIFSQLASVPPAAHSTLQITLSKIFLNSSFPQKSLLIIFFTVLLHSHQ